MFKFEKKTLFQNAAWMKDMWNYIVYQHKTTGACKKSKRLKLY
jgi:hypothetical protein